MSRSPMPSDERVLDRLTELALEGDGPSGGAVSADEERWLLELELAAAEADLAFGPPASEYEEMPAGVRERLESLADDLDAGRAPDTGPVAKIAGGDVVYGGRVHPISTAGGIVPAWVGWVAAVAVLVLAFVLWPSTATTGPGSADLVAQREALIEDGAPVMSWGDWALEGEGPEIAGVTGDVVWDEATETGYMRFTNLPELEDAVYQLWIVDERGLFTPDGRSARISGGVFTADSGSVTEDGDLIVPITPRLDVRNAGLFAVTIEEPGGVWTSDMSRRVVVAAKG